MPVECVQKLGAELDPVLFLEGVVLLQAEVLADHAKVADLRQAKSRIPERQRRRVGEQGLVQIGVSRQIRVDDLKRRFVEPGSLQIAGRDISAIPGAVPSTA